MNREMIKKNRDRVDDVYIKGLLCQGRTGIVRSRDIPSELVTVKRLALIRKRNATNQDRANESFTFLTKKSNAMIEYFLTKSVFMIQGGEKPLTQDDKIILLKLEKELSAPD